MRGIVLIEDNPAVRQQAKRRGLAVTVGGPLVAYERTLVVGPGAAVPWSLVGAGFDYLERWEAAAPLWRYGVLAADVGTTEERERTRAVCRDLRLPLYAPELLFVRDCEGGRALVQTWHAEAADSPTSYHVDRLAFLRALYITKPLFLALPRSWLSEAAAVATPSRRPTGRGVNLVHVEIAPGRTVCCRPDEVEEYKRRFAAYRATEGRRC